MEKRRNTPLLRYAEAKIRSAARETIFSIPKDSAPPTHPPFGKPPTPARSAAAPPAHAWGEKKTRARSRKKRKRDLREKCVVCAPRVCFLSKIYESIILWLLCARRERERDGARDRNSFFLIRPKCKGSRVLFSCCCCARNLVLHVGRCMRALRRRKRDLCLFCYWYIESLEHLQYKFMFAYKFHRFNTDGNAESQIREKRRYLTRNYNNCDE